LDGSLSGDIAHAPQPKATNANATYISGRPLRYWIQSDNITVCDTGNDPIKICQWKVIMQNTDTGETNEQVGKFPFTLLCMASRKLGHEIAEQEHTQIQ
jgi:hypothetical protein